MKNSLILEWEKSSYDIRGEFIEYLDKAYGINGILKSLKSHKEREKDNIPPKRSVRED